MNTTSQQTSLCKAFSIPFHQEETKSIAKKKPTKFLTSTKSNMRTSRMTCLQTCQSKVYSLRDKSKWLTDFSAWEKFMKRKSRIWSLSWRRKRKRKRMKSSVIWNLSTQAGETSHLWVEELILKETSQSHLISRETVEWIAIVVLYICQLRTGFRLWKRSMMKDLNRKNSKSYRVKLQK